MIALAPLLVALGTAAPPTPASLRVETQALLARWAAAQQRGDAAAYLGLYDARNFHGVKRTTSGERKKYDYAAWAADRSRLIKNQPEVAVEEVRVDTWLDARPPGAKPMRPGVVNVRFVQRWRSPRYADHGPKIMQLLRGADGKLRIIYEALLQSRPGWERPQGNVVALAVPKNDDEALAAWRKLAPTGKTWETTLASLPETPQLRRALARGLLARVDFHCKQIVDEGNCGVEDLSWAPIPDAATVDDPCLARQLAEWALTEGGLGAGDVRALWPRLEPVFAWSGVDDKLCQAVLTASAVEPGLEADAIVVAVDKKCADAEARARVAGLPEATRVTLAERGVDEAFAGLDAKKHAAVFLEGLKGGGSARRVDVMQRLAKARPSPELKAALRQVVNADQDFEAAAMAASVLAELGDASSLPRRPNGGDEALFERALRLLQHDPDGARAAAALRAFMPKKGKLKIATTTLTEYDGNTAPEDRDPEHHETERVDYDQVDLETLRPFFAPEEGQAVTLVWKTLGGKLYLVGVDIEIKRFVGCPC